MRTARNVNFDGCYLFFSNMRSDLILESGTLAVQYDVLFVSRIGHTWDFMTKINPAGENALKLVRAQHI